MKQNLTLLLATLKFMAAGKDSLTDFNGLSVHGGNCDPICEKLDEVEQNTSIVSRHEDEVISLVGPNGELDVAGVNYYAGASLVSYKFSILILRGQFD